MMLLILLFKKQPDTRLFRMKSWNWMNFFLHSDAKTENRIRVLFTAGFTTLPRPSSIDVAFIYPEARF